MSTQIDERVVSMKFDNKDFEKNVARTMDTLEKLDEQLDFKDAKANFKKLEDAANGVTLSGLVKSAEAVKVEFSVMSMFAISAINKIVDMTFDAGAKMIKNLSIDQITAGFGKYESKLNSVQAIMNSTGKSIEEVELQMSRLMTYTDETSYSFTDMVANIGTFTSNRIDLETATKSMMGIANAAGFAGVNSEKASHAMQGFSKAMGQGFMDRSAFTWLKTASMAIPELKEQFIEAAVAAGTLTKTNEGLYKTLKGNTVTVENFETALKDQWLTTGVLNTALGKFGAYSEALMQIMDETKLSASDAMDILDEYIKTSGDETLAYSAKMFKAAQAYRTFGDAITATRDAVSTGWMDTFDIIFGNLEEARDLWKTVGDLLYDVFAQPIKDRNKMLLEWKGLGGRDDILEAFFNAVENATEVVGALRKALDSVFPPMTAQRLKDMTERFKNFISYFKMSEPALYSLSVIMKTILIPFRVMFELFKVGVLAIASLTKVTFALINAFLELAAVGNPITMLLEKIFGEERYARLSAAFDTLRTKIGDILKSIADKIKSSFGADSLFQVFLTIAETIGKVLAPIADILLDGIVWGFEKLASMDFTSIQSFMSDMLRFFGSIGSGVLTLFTTGFGNAAEALKEFKGFSLKSWFTGLKTDVKGITAEVTGLSKAFSEEGIVKNITNAASIVSGKLATIGGAVGDLVGQISPAGIIVSGLGLTFIELSHNISLAIGSFAKVGTSLAGLMDSVKGVFTNIQTVIKTFNKTLEGKIQVEKFKALSLVIISFAGALTILSFVGKNNQNLLEVVGIVGLLLAEMAAFFGVMAAINKFGAVGDGAVSSIKQFAITLSVMAASLLLLASAIKIVSRIDITHIWQQMSALIAGIIAMTMSLKAIANSDKQVTEGAMVIVAFAFALRSIAKTLVTLSKANFENIPGTLVMLAGVIGAMYLLSKMAKNISWSGGTGMFAMVVSILALTGVLTILAKVDVGALIIGMSKYILLFGVMLTLALAAKAATKAMGDGSVGSIALMFLSMAAAVSVLSLAIKTIGKMSLAEVIRGTTAVAAVLGMFALITLASKRGILDGQDAKQSFAGMAVAILALTLAIDYLGGLDAKKLVKGTLAVGALMGMFALLELVKAQNKSITGSAVFIGVTIAALVAALAILQMFDFHKLMKATISLSAILVAFGQTLKYIGNVTGKKGSVLAMIEIVTMVTTFSSALYVLSRQDWKGLLAASLGLSAVMLAFGALTQMINNMEATFKKTLKALLQFSLVIGALMLITTGMVALINLIPANENLVEKVTAFSLVLAAVSGVAVVLNKMSMDVGKTAKGIASVLVVMAALAAVSVALWAVCSSTDWNSITANADPIIASLTMAIVLIGVCAALGVAIGAVGKAFDPGAVATGVADVLVVLAGILAVIGALGLVMIALNELDKQFGVSGALSNGAEMLVDLFINVGSAIGGFIGGIIGGIGQGIVKGSKLDEIAQILNEFVNAFADIPEDSLNKCVSVISSMASLFASLPETEFSLKSFIFGGRTEIDKVFDGLDGFVGGIKNMSEQIGDGSDINVNGIQKAVNAAKIVSDFENTLPKTGGLVQAWFGEGNLGKFAENMGAFANALWKYYVNTKSISNWGLFEQGKTAGQFIVDLNKQLPQTGFLQTLMGEQNLGKFADNMASFGNALYSFYTSTSDISDWTAFSNAEIAGKAVAEVAKTVAGIDYGVFSGTITLSEFGFQLNSLGSNMKQYSSNISSISWDTFNEATTNLSSLVETMSGADRVGISTITTFTSSMASLAKTGFDSFVSAFTGADAKVTLDGTASTLIGNLTSSLNTHSANADYYSIGKQTVQGLSNGITTNVSIVKNASMEAADALCTSMERVLQINSPSKRTQQIGKYAMMGLEKGLLENKTITNSAASNVAEGVLQSMKNTLEIHSPSYRVRQEVAKPILEAIPAEFDENNAAEKAAKAKGEAIFTAFKSAFTDNNEIRDFLNLQKELFELKLSPDLSDAERQSAMDEYNIQYQKDVLKSYVDDYKLAVQQYQTVVKEMGEESSMAKEAQKTMLQQEITLRKYAAEMVTVTSDSIQEATTQSIENWKSYYEFLNSDQFTNMLQGQLKGGIRLGEVNILDDADPRIMQMNATERMQAEMKAFEAAVRDGDWETRYAKALEPIKESLYQQYQSMYIDPNVEKMRYATPETSEDILKEFFDGLTIDEYAMQDVAGEISESFMTALEESLKETAKTASSAGSSTASAYKDGFSGGLNQSPSIGEELNQAIKDALGNLGGDEDGNKLFEGTGLMATLDNWTNTFTGWISNLGGAAKEAVTSGSNVVAGLVEGITGSNSRKELEQVSLDMGEDVIDDTNHALGNASPSKRTYESGMNVVLGLRNGIDDYSGLAVNAANDLGAKVLSALRGETKINGSIGSFGRFDTNLSPVITPVLDLTEVENGVAEIKAMFSELEAKALSVQMSIDKNQNGSTGGPSTISAKPSTTVTFNQYNSSPKALDQIEIYRQTNNQLSVLKEGLKDND